MTGKIFINYRREDERVFAARIRDRLALSLGGSAVFMDVDNLMAGQRFDKELDKALGETDIFVAVIGPRWMDLFTQRLHSSERDFVREEIAGALKRGIVVIPVLIEKTPLPRIDELPEDICELVMHQKQDISHEQFGRDIEGLIAAINFSHKSTDKSTRNTAPSQAFLLWSAVLAIGLIAGGYAGAYYFGAPLPWPETAVFHTNSAPTAIANKRISAETDERQSKSTSEIEAERLAKAKAEAERSRIELEEKRLREAIDARLKAEATARARAIADEEVRAKADEARRQRQAAIKAEEDRNRIEAETTRLREEARNLREEVEARRRSEAAAKSRAEEAERRRIAALQVEEDRERAAAEIARNRGPRLWNHNGSTMRLEAEGARRRFYYQSPRQGMLDEGVTAGTLLFEGTRNGDNYSGTAYLFSRQCGRRSYSVSGTTSNSDRNVTMHGQAPRLDARCNVVGYRSDELAFDLIGN